jgi:proline racemase
VDARALGLAVEPANLTRFVELGREIKDHLNATAEISHPLEPRLRDVYGTIFFEEAEGPGLAQRNVTVFADGEVDRSPRGSGTSARLALLHADGGLATGETLDLSSIVGTRFEGRVVEETEVAGIPAVVTEVGATRTSRGTTSSSSNGTTPSAPASCSGSRPAPVTAKNRAGQPSFGDRPYVRGSGATARHSA